MSERSIGELGKTIAHLTEVIESGISEHGLTSPTINDEVMNHLPSVCSEAAQQLAEATRELEVLVQGPRPVLGMLGLAVRSNFG